MNAHSQTSDYEKGPERFLHDSAGFVSCCFAFGDGPDQRVASPGVVCAIRLRRRGSAERRPDLRASIEGGAPAPEHHLFVRLSTDGSDAQRRNNLMGRSVVSVFVIDKSRRTENSAGTAEIHPRGVGLCFAGLLPRLMTTLMRHVASSRCSATRFVSAGVALVVSEATRQSRRRSSALMITSTSTGTDAHDLMEGASERRLIRKARQIRNVGQ